MQKIERKPTRQITLGGLKIGGGAPISIQSMLTTKTADVASSLRQIFELEKAGCEIVRFAVTSPEEAAAIPKLKAGSTIVLVADIHYDYKLALLSIKNGIDGLRINPGNIGSSDKVKEVVKAAAEKMIPIRIGVNSGSLPTYLTAKYGLSATAMVEAALEHVRILEDLNYLEMKISVKASGLDLMIQSYRELS
ncbi:MAG: flavodoxin-dependent (E)-4-hydroxy-3-methylbut-2-enyl-diphosphate synthase, partial [Candidatus Cloacimonadaceae bacterium]|nr:flavodoxin-dependent (E)-4-hydroxy-3-methylbut-2-enyl-diphosphate synthase [Candidatus Cloacimonadaceae bacterium]